MHEGVAMKPHLERETERLKRKVLALSALVEESLEKAVTAVAHRDRELAEQVILSDPLIDDAEVEVEEECLKLLALYQPVAIDLRFLVAILKLNNDLERIGDLAVNIAEQALALAGAEAPERPPDLTTMVRRVQAMLKSTLDALVNLDAREATTVCAADDEVDWMHKQTYAWFVAAVKRRPEDASGLTHYLSVSRNLERIADHATNIAEDVIYMTEGRIVRHRGNALARH